MREFNEHNATDAVIARFADTPDARLKEIMTVVVKHLHAAVKELEPTMDEWMAAIDFLTRTGQKCDDVRQEFILLSDTLGVSMLVDAINHRKPAGATESTVLGPFHMVESPPREIGADIALDGKGEPTLVTGQVIGEGGKPVPGALVDVWQANDEGFYDVQQPDIQPERNLRGLFTADGEGRFWFRTILPRFYPIPTDGPVGEMLNAAKRHPYRPAHVHFIVAAKGYEPVVTHLFVEGDDYLESDAVFAVKESLIKEFATVDDPARAKEHGIANPFRHIHHEFTLAPARQAAAGSA